jgi:hypothetical protein
MRMRVHDPYDLCECVYAHGVCTLACIFMHVYVRVAQCVDSALCAAQWGLLG